MSAVQVIIRPSSSVVVRPESPRVIIKSVTGPTGPAGGGGGGGAPTDATFLTLTSNGTLTNERTLTAGTGLTLTDGGANSTATLALNSRETLSTVGTSGSSQTLNISTANVHDITLTAACTLTFSGSAASVANSFTLIARQGGSGSYAITWPASVDWPGGTAPTISTVVGRVDVFTFVTVDNGTTWLGFAAGIGVR